MCPIGSLQKNVHTVFWCRSVANINETGHRGEEREEDHVRSFTAFPKEVALFQIESSRRHECPDAVSVEFIFRAEMCVGNSVQYRLKGHKPVQRRRSGG